MGRKNIDAMWDRKNLKNMNDNFYELFLNMGDHVSLIRNLLGSTDNVLPIPPNGEPMRTYAESINDPYFNGLMSLKTSPGLTVNRDSSFEISPEGYFFYTMNAVKDLAPNEKMSFIVYTSENNNNFKLEYNFIDSSGKSIGGITGVEESVPNVYLIEGLSIPVGTNKIDLRLDNRTGNTTVQVDKLIIVASERMGLFNFSSTDIKIDLDEQVKKVNDKIDKLNEQGLTIAYEQPKDFELKDHVLKSNIYTDGRGTFDTALDIESFKNTDGKTYYVSGDGLNANDGLSSASPLADIYTAMNKSNVGTIMVDGRFIYNRTASGNVIGYPNKDINIIGYNGKPKMATSNTLKYTKTPDYQNVYQASRNGTMRVINIHEKDEYGDHLEFTKVGSIAEVDSTPNSWYSASGIVYVNQDNGEVNDDDIQCLLSTDLIRFNGDFNVYLENIELLGGARNIRFETTNGRLVMNNVKASYSTQSNGNGLEMVGGSYCISKDCEFSKQMMDGFNYHKSSNGALPYFVEIDCIARDNGVMKGTSGNRSDNGSTSHDGIKGIRVNGLYARNDGGNLADVNTGTQTWNLGCIAFGSYQVSDFQTTTGAHQFLDSCEGFGSNYSVQSVNADDKVYIRRGQFQSKNISGTEMIY